MDLHALTKAYIDLPPRDQAALAMTIGSHQAFNASPWKDEITRRHREIDAGRGLDVHEVEAILRRLDQRTA